MPLHQQRHFLFVYPGLSHPKITHLFYENLDRGAKLTSIA